MGLYQRVLVLGLLFHSPFAFSDPSLIESLCHAGSYDSFSQQPALMETGRSAPLGRVSRQDFAQEGPCPSVVKFLGAGVLTCEDGSGLGAAVVEVETKRGECTLVVSAELIEYATRGGDQIVQDEVALTASVSPN